MNASNHVLKIAVGIAMSLLVNGLIAFGCIAAVLVH